MATCSRRAPPITSHLILLLLILVGCIQQTSQSYQIARTAMFPSTVACQLPTTSVSRSHQLQHVLAVLDQVRQQQQQLTARQLQQLVEQLQQLHECIKVSRQQLDVEQDDYEMFPPLPSHRPVDYSAQEALWSRQDVMDSRTSSNVAEVDSARRHSGSHSIERHRIEQQQQPPLDSNSFRYQSQDHALYYGNDATVPQYAEQQMPNPSLLDRNSGSLPKSYSNLKNNLDERNPSTSYIMPFVSGTKSQHDFDRHEAMQSVTNGISGTRYRGGKPFSNRPTHTTYNSYLITHRQTEQPSFITPPLAISGEGDNPAFVGSGTVLALGSASELGGGGTGISGVGVREHSCRCLSRRAMLGLIVSGVSATALTAYISALFQRRVGSGRKTRVETERFRELAMGAVDSVCTMGVDAAWKEMWLDESAINDRKAYSHMLNGTSRNDLGVIKRNGNMLSVGKTDTTKRLRRAIRRADQTENQYNTLAFDLMDTPMISSANDPGPMPLSIQNFKSTETGPGFEEKPQDVFKKYATYVSDKKKYSKLRHTDRIVRNMSNLPQDSQDLFADINLKAANSSSKDMIAKSSSVSDTNNHQTDEETINLSSDQQAVTDHNIRRSSSGELEEWEKEDADEDTKSASFTMPSLFSIVSSMIGGKVPGIDSSPFKELSNIFQTSGNDNNAKRDAKNILSRPMKIIGQFFFKPKRRVGQRECGCVTLDSKQLGAVGSPAQALVMSGVLLGYILIQTMSLYTRNGRSKDNSALLARELMALLGPVIDKKTARTMRDSNTVVMPQSSGEEKLLHRIKALIKTVDQNNKSPLLEYISKAIEAPSIECSRYYMCKTQHQGALTHEPLNAITPLLRLPLSWLLARRHGDHVFVQLCDENGATNCQALRNNCIFSLESLSKIQAK